jgi:hypothetical protein
MTGAHRLACQMATLLLLLTLTTLPAKAQFGGGGGDMMTQMAPMLEMMKAKMGKRRFGAMMQTMGPMMSRMMENGGGFGGGGGIPGGFSGGDVTGMLGSSGGGELMSMIPQVMQMVNLGGGHGHRRHRRRQ